MSVKYRYDRVPSRHVGRQTLTVLGIFIVVLVVLAGGIGVFALLSHRHQLAISGAAKEVVQTTAKVSYFHVDEPLFTMNLPSDWKEIGSQDAPTIHSISWQATLKGADNRYLTIYIDTIPASMPVNRELAVEAHGNRLTYGQISDNCYTFTPGGTDDVAQAESLKPTLSTWQGVKFICNLSQIIDSETGTSSTGGVNSVTVTGPTGGTHSYFFLYTDRNIQPDDTILYEAIQSFQAK